MPKSGFNYNCGLHVQQDAKLGCENIKNKVKREEKEDDSGGRPMVKHLSC